MWILFINIYFLSLIFSTAFCGADTPVFVLDEPSNASAAFIPTDSGVLGPLQCTKNSDETYAVCASNSKVAVKFNLQPFSYAAKGSDEEQTLNMVSCDLFEKQSSSSQQQQQQQDSRAVCVQQGGMVFFYRVSDMTLFTNLSSGDTATSPHVVVDSKNEIAYVSNNHNIPSIRKIINIGSSAPSIQASLAGFGPGDGQPGMMLLIAGDEYLYVHFQ